MISLDMFHERKVVFMYIRYLFIFLFYVTVLDVTIAASNRTSPRIYELDRIVAIVDQDVITQSELETRVRRIKLDLQNRNTRLPSDKVLRRQVLERIILEQLQLQMANRVGIRVDDETINRVITKIAKDNKLVLDEFREVLKKDGVAFADFRRSIKTEIIINRLRQRQVDNKVIVTEQEVNNQLSNTAKRGDLERELLLAHILIAVPEEATPEQIKSTHDKAKKVLTKLRNGADFGETAVSVSNGQHALDGGILGWRKAGQLPSIFIGVVDTLKPDEIGDLVRSSSGFHIIKLLEQRSHIQKYEVNQTLVRHILIQTNQLVSNDEARLQLQRLRERIIGGEDFSLLARAHSNDKVSANKGGNLGWTNPGDLVSQFQAIMDKLKPGTISQLFRTPYGWHILEVMARRKQDNTDEFLRTRAREQIHRRKVDEAAQNWLRSLREEAYVKVRLNQ